MKLAALYLTIGMMVAGYIGMAAHDKGNGGGFKEVMVPIVLIWPLAVGAIIYQAQK